MRRLAVARRTILTERLELQPVVPRHVLKLHEAVLASRPELLPWMPWARDPSLEVGRATAAATRREWRADREFHFVAIERGTRVVLGVVGLNRVDRDTAELHYWIRSDRAGRGFATEGSHAVLAWSASALGIRRLTLWAGRENLASRRVAEKLGFHHVGPLSWRPKGGLGHFAAESYELRLTPGARVIS